MSRPAARRPASWTIVPRLRSRASTSPGTSTARATTCSAAATESSSTATWGTSSTTTRCGWRRTPYQVATDFWAGGGYGNGVGLTYDTVQPGHAVKSHRQHRHQLADPRLVHVAEDAQLQRARTPAGIPWSQVVEASYVGTRGRNLVSRSNGNVMPYGALSSGTFNGVDLSVPVNRVAVASVGTNLSAFRPYNALNRLTQYGFRGETKYDSMQVTLSRQTGRRLQYFVAYTLAQSRGTLGDEYSTIDPYDPARTYGVLNQDRTHVLNLSWNAFLPDAARGAMNNPFGRGLLNGWQVSGISSMASGIPLRLSFSGDAASGPISAAYFGTADVVGPSLSGGNGLAPAYTCDPRLNGTDVGEKILDVNCISVPAFGENGELVSPYNIRTPTRWNNDVTLFKNFEIKGDQKIQFRVGFFNIFNQAFANPFIGNDINLTLDTRCRVRVTGVADGAGGTQDVCDPTRGFDFTPQTIDNFGKIALKRGHRVVEFVLKYYF